jgi:hypothetical protein
MSVSRIGKPSAFKGKKHTEESKEKMRLSNLGKEPWNKGIKVDIDKFPAWGNFKHGKANKLDYIREQRRIKLEEKAGRPKPSACEICGRERKICFDHCHKTGNFRGWICDKCNLILGQVNDDRGWLIKLSDYLKQHEF